MKKFDPIDQKLLGSRIDESNAAFVATVMEHVAHRAIKSRLIRTTNEHQSKETFIMKLRHVPKFAIVAAAIGLLGAVSGTAYATVRLIESSRSQVKETKTNSNGKTEIALNKNLCKTQDQRYELKAGVDLSPAEAAKYINAHCHLRLISDTLDLKGKVFTPMTASGSIVAKNSESLQIEVYGKKYEVPFKGVGYFDTNVTSVDAGAFKVGDTILAYRDMGLSAESPIQSIFKTVEDAQYYDQLQQQNIRAVKPCANNATMDCVVPSNVNSVILIADRGGNTMPASGKSRDMQGRLVDHSSAHFTLENNGRRITFQTPYDVVEKYNTTTVFGLKDYDTVYSRTSPETLKIAIGDSLYLSYSSLDGSNTVAWKRLGIIQLMVERTANDLNVLQKY